MSEWIARRFRAIDGLFPPFNSNELGHSLAISGNKYSHEFWMGNENISETWIIVKSDTVNHMYYLVRWSGCPDKSLITALQKAEL